jgi:hypothetical protein
MATKKIYITTMYRWGSKENHSYVLYAGFKKKQAIEQGWKEKSDKGGKYSPEVIAVIPDSLEKYKIIVPLEDWK